MPAPTRARRSYGMTMTFRWCPNVRCPKVEGKAWPARYVVTKDMPGMPDVDPIHCENCGARLTTTDPTVKAGAR